MSMPTVHRAILTQALRAPSAHNAQPWRLVIAADDYELHYDHLDYLPHDPDDRDAYLAIGGFLQTLEFAAQRHGYRSSCEFRYIRNGSDLFVGTLTLRPSTAAEPVDPLAAPAADRRTNRHPYDAAPLPDELRASLEQAGCALVSAQQIASLVARASVLSWGDRRFVADLKAWFTGDPTAPAGMTPAAMPLTRLEWAALRFVMRLGKLPAPLARFASLRDVRLLARAPGVAVLGAGDLTPPVLVDAGRRLVRCWVAINAAGFSYHPISIAVDRSETAPEVAAVAGVPVPVAVFRIGRATKSAPPSNRRSLDDVLRARL